MNATGKSGHLNNIPKCYIQIGNFTLEMNNLPDLGDSKNATFESQNIPGRSSPMVTYSHSEARNIPVTITLVVQDKSDCKKNIAILRKIQSTVYPRRGPAAPYFPPALCKIKCGSLLSDNPICVIMKDYNIKFPQDVPWDEETLCPYKMDISMSFEQVFSSNALPNNEMIMQDSPIGSL